MALKRTDMSEDDDGRHVSEGELSNGTCEGSRDTYPSLGRNETRHGMSAKRTGALSIIGRSKATVTAAPSCHTNLRKTLMVTV